MDLSVDDAEQELPTSPLEFSSLPPDAAPAKFGSFSLCSSPSNYGLKQTLLPRIDILAELANWSNNLLFGERDYQKKKKTEVLSLNPEIKIIIKKKKIIIM